MSSICIGSSVKTVVLKSFPSWPLGKRVEPVSFRPRPRAILAVSQPEKEMVQESELAGSSLPPFRQKVILCTHQWVINFQFQSEESSCKIIKQLRSVSLLSSWLQSLPRGDISQMGAGVGNMHDSMGVHCDIFLRMKQENKSSNNQKTWQAELLWVCCTHGDNPFSPKKFPKNQFSLCALGVSDWRASCLFERTRLRTHPL